ncbi:MAG: response regulator transcription factor [Bacteroidales bacterium]|nr:response regulator transcription factor [Bacteroidales bacterium]
MPTDHPTVLLIEDDRQLGHSLKESLESKNYLVEWESSGSRALQLFNRQKYDICLVDNSLPDMSGTDFVKEIRQTDFFTPMLIMSGNSSDREKILAFCAGGDDYITKPFSNTELALRIYALLKRTKPEKISQKMPDLVKFGSYRFDYPNRILCTPSREISLTKKESEVLRMLVQNLNNIVKREQILISVWGENDYFMGRSMDVYIARLRKKLNDDNRVSIVNVHRMGFKLKVNPEAGDQ